MVFQLIINTLNYKKMISKIQNISFLFIILFPFTGNSQITFDKSKKELIRACELGNLKTFIREISVDSLLVVFNLTDLKATGSDDIFLAYESENHKVEFKATYKELESLNSWIKERHSTQTGGTVKLGQWELSFIEPGLLSLSLFLWTGPTGNFETAINPNQIEKCLTQKYIDRAIQRHAEKKKSKDRQETKREMLRKAKAKRDSVRKAKRKSKG